MEKINKETSTDVRKLIDTLSKHLRAIVQLGQKIENWDALIIFIITSKLPKFVNQDWEKHNKKIKEPTIEQLREFLIDRADFLQTMESKSHERGTEFAETKNNANNRSGHTRGLLSENVVCTLCKKSHSISNCSAFSKLNVNERISKAKYLRLCLNCLKPGHFNYVCRANTCKKCNSKHHVLLHIDKNFETPATNGESAGGSVALSAYSSTNFVLLSTASVVVMGERGKKSIVRAVLDSGSQSSYLVADLCDELEIEKEKINLTVEGINNTVSQIKYKCSVEIQSVSNDYKKVIECFVVPEITGVVPNVPIDMTKLNMPRNVALADPNFTVPSRISMLIGADLFYDLLCIGQTKLGPGMPILQRTRLGWIVSGCIPNDAVSCNRKNNEVNSDVQQQLTRFWEIEELGGAPALSYEEKMCEQHFATRCIKELAIQHQSSEPEVAEIIMNCFYVDDMLMGANSFEDAVRLGKGVFDILKGGGFDLRKWSSNNDEILRAMNVSAFSDDSVMINDSECFKALGLSWNKKSDTFIFKVSPGGDDKMITKRSILSVISQLFDPMGLISPCVIIAKIILQKLWLEKIDWDSAVSKQLEIEWIKLRDNLVELNKLKICRNVICNDALKVELHGFCDASAEAYGAAVYVRSIDTEGKIHVCLLSAKSKVAPLKTISIPRLELCGALILAKLIEKVTDSVKVEFENVYCWTDSTVVLGWLKTTPNLLKTFIANRVSEIQTLESQKQCQWRHVPTKMNPADILSRGMYPKELLTAHMWWNGPVFLLKHESDWPEIKQYGCPLPEIRDKSKMLLSVASESFPIEKFSSLTKLKHVVAYLFRFVKNASVSSENKLTGSLTLEEVDNAFLSLIKCAQKECFAQEICDLESKRKINKKSKLLMLNPFLDKNNVLRVGGRLKNSAYSYDKRHPMILSPKHHLSKLIFEREHLKLYHAGPQALLAAIRERFWVISGKSLAKYVIKKCITCYRYNAKILNPIMGNLPKARFDGHYPFEVTGVDYAGPLLVKDKKGRGAKLQKCYVCLFICFSTKAVHIELVTDLSTESFILTLRRFVSRRGRPRQIWSDNGGNFVGANSELKELGHFLSKNKKSLCESLVNEEIHWQFIPAHSPHFGGLWEAGIKSVKYHLKRVIGEQHLIFEELYTLLVQIESVLNSRPISPLSTNPNDLFPLTPAHFLLGRTASEIPDPDVLHIKPSKLSQFQRIQSIKQQFWKRWSLEYVSELQLRKRWTVNDNRKLEPGILVLIKQDNLPPMKWKLGRVLSVSSDVDGVPRVARLKTDSGEIQRAFSKLCPLPIDD
nr:unnamed protein product [Callosobruchus analis]